MNKPQQPAPLANLILAQPSDGDSAFHLEVREYRRADRNCYIHMKMPFVPDSNWPRMMPTRITAIEGGAQVDLWQRDFNKSVYPYLHDIGGECVIVFLKDGMVAHAIVVGHLLFDYSPETTEVIAMKKAAAEFVALHPKWSPLELDVIDRLAERAAAATAPAATPPAAAPVIALRDVTAAPAEAPAAPVKAPAPAPAVSAKKAASVAVPKAADADLEVRRAALLERSASMVYDAETGATLAGIPVNTKEFKFLTVGEFYVQLSNKGRPQFHFVCIRTEGRPYDEQVAVTEHPPVIPTSADAALPVTVH